MAASGAATVASRWKNRIAFPSKKKEKAAQEDGGDSAIYNAMNKDLRTVVERSPALSPTSASAGDRTAAAGLIRPAGAKEAPARQERKPR